MVGLDELKVPKTVRLVADEIVAITDAVCLAVLDEEYADLARRAVAKLARKRPSPLLRGRRAGWAAGVVYALGQANFLFDPAVGPTATADQLSEVFGVAKATMGSKARQVRDLLGISPFSPEFERADVGAQNPLKWIIEVDGLAVDVRHVPLDIQVAAFEHGVIPYVPALGPSEQLVIERRFAGAPRAGDGAPRSDGDRNRRHPDHRWYRREPCRSDPLGAPLSRIRDGAAYEELQRRAREIEEPKQQF